MSHVVVEAGCEQAAEGVGEQHGVPPHLPRDRQAHPLHCLYDRNTGQETVSRNLLTMI